MEGSASQLKREIVAKLAEALVKEPLILERGKASAKIRLAERLGLSKLPRNTDLIWALKELGAPSTLIKELRRKPVRTRSGVTIITVAIPLFNCPHGRCIYCPGGGETGFPQSYTGAEPVISYAHIVGYDIEAQVKAYLKRLENMGHEVDKVEIIFIGGTYTSADPEAQKGYIKAALDGLHGSQSGSVEEALLRAEHKRPRVAGMMVETRPDWINPQIADELVRLGVTRVELGVQALDDEIYRRIARGHTVRDVVEATRVLRDRAFKVGYHFMPGLPHSNPAKDFEMYETLFKDARFRPDTVKIYPTMVIPGTPLHTLWSRGEYKPYELDVLVDLLVRMLSITPPYVRIHRIRREIPSHVAADGKYPGNLRELVEREAARRSIKCKCVRCREVGRQTSLSFERLFEMEIRELRYETLGGREVFLSYETRDGEVLAGLLRLRLPDEAANELLRDAALVRELHVYGEMTPVGRAASQRGWQHRGIGTQLLRRAEEIAAREGYDKVVVISGLGVKEYYMKRGYSRHGPYVAKRLT
ncbi:MAG: tRNA uridine(34) 5-carboxymethylaminomethyl modification radical SAM/GNAT enzyme Elp3 [Nitrososphaerota archaeon]|nr:tRNA uridine(34) 5-carboxymethylaminomethyl modification radical SAM/GNAT enzyme Elp3 [Candidatus Calditenuaceae archaeon]MDW8072784.1 tRNA uridine(34) 5-carboxymethylaminomethyl modification radical SAM/GNAT enzyme Elp3 [Nitrososphaerota archaeon]